MFSIFRSCLRNHCFLCSHLAFRWGLWSIPHCICGSPNLFSRPVAWTTPETWWLMQDLVIRDSLRKTRNTHPSATARRSHCTLKFEPTRVCGMSWNRDPPFPHWCPAPFFDKRLSLVYLDYMLKITWFYMWDLICASQSIHSFTKTTLSYTFQEVLKVYSMCPPTLFFLRCSLFQIPFWPIYILETTSPLKKHMSTLIMVVFLYRSAWRARILTLWCFYPWI